MPFPLLVQLLITVALAVITYLITPKPKTEKLKAANAVDVPTTEAGRTLPVIFGTVMIRDPNVVWFGDMKVKAVKKSGGKK